MNRIISYGDTFHEAESGVTSNLGGTTFQDAESGATYKLGPDTGAGGGGGVKSGTLTLILNVVSRTVCFPDVDEITTFPNLVPVVPLTIV